MKDITKFVAWLLLSIPSFKKKEFNWGGRFSNGGMPIQQDKIKG